MWVVLDGLGFELVVALLVVAGAAEDVVWLAEADVVVRAVAGAEEALAVLELSEEPA